MVGAIWQTAPARTHAIVLFTPLVQVMGVIWQTVRGLAHVVLLLCCLLRLSKWSELSGKQREVEHRLFCCYVVYSATVSGGSHLANSERLNTGCFVDMLFTPLL